jgi:hypothetical protein
MMGRDQINKEPCIIFSMFDIGTVWKWFRKTFAAQDIVSLGILHFFYFVTRIINLDKFPIFTDEGIYIHWAKISP